MTGEVLRCPQCGGSLKPSRFGSTTTCPYCGAVIRLGPARIEARRFHRTHARWNSPEDQGFTSWITVDGGHWAPVRHLAEGEVARVSLVRRARWPSELAVLKELRRSREEERFRSEWKTLVDFWRNPPAGQQRMARTFPRPIAFGKITHGGLAGSLGMLLEWAPGFRWTFAQVRRAWPEGIEPRAAVWMWRRILELVTMMHRQHLVHGAVVPEHLLVEEGEHGVRLVGFGRTGRRGSPLIEPTPAMQPYYPAWALDGRGLHPGLDLVTSARSIAFVLGADPDAWELPSHVPTALASAVRDVAGGEESTVSGLDPWALREELGVIARKVWGAPAYCPVAMPTTGT